MTKQLQKYTAYRSDKLAQSRAPPQRAGYATATAPPIMVTVKAYATLGENCGAWRAVFDDQPPTAV
ncbi:MAG TPA: hypothetical protein VKQ30_06630 [Ktedonobacterales bacterium]|nr:hypothetical protein [Ktedonobacterales bacterium]